MRTKCAHNNACFHVNTQWLHSTWINAVLEVKRPLAGLQPLSYSLHSETSTLKPPPSIQQSEASLPQSLPYSLHSAVSTCQANSSFPWQVVADAFSPNDYAHFPSPLCLSPPPSPFLPFSDSLFLPYCWPGVAEPQLIPPLVHHFISTWD